MKKAVLFCTLVATVYANNDYLSLSKMSDEKKLEYNFISLDKTVIDAEKVETKSIIEEGYETISNEAEKTEVIINKEIEETKINNPIQETKKQIIETEVKAINLDNTQKKEEIDKKITNEKFVNEYKKDNILQDVKKSNIASSKDFTITPKFTYSYLKTDHYVSGKVSVVDEKSVLMPELSFSYKNHTLKAETMSVKTYFNGVIIGNNDLSMKNSWHKLNYLYKYQNANIGLAYNVYEGKGNFIFNDLSYYFKDKQTFPSLELHLENEEDKIKVEYGVSYGNNNEIDYAYEYYLNLGYKIFNNDNLIISAGYKNKTIEIGDIRFQHKGPTISLGGSF